MGCEKNLINSLIDTIKNDLGQKALITFPIITALTASRPVFPGQECDPDHDKALTESQ